jgi:autotransporter-associated beta strand protein
VAVFGIILVQLSLSGTGFAANGTWTVSSGDWTNAGSWTPGIPGSTDTAFFSNNPPNAPVSVNVDAAQSINIFNFTSNGSRTYTFSGSDLTFLTKNATNDARILTGASAVSAVTINNNVVIAAGFNGTDSVATFTIGGTLPTTSNFSTITFNGNILSGSGAGLKTLAINSSATSSIVINGSNTAGSLSFAGSGELIAGSTSALGAGYVQKTTNSLLSLRSDVTVTGVGAAYSWTAGANTTPLRISELSASSADRTLTFNNRTVSTGGAMQWVDNVNSTGKLILELKYTGATAQTMDLITNSSAIVRFAQSGNTTFDSVISGAGQVEKTVGSGTTTLNATSTYTGKTIVSAGTLLLSGTGSIGGTSELHVGSGASFSTASISASSYAFGANQTVAGFGTVISGNKSLTVDGVLNPGNTSGSSNGTLTFNLGTGSLTLGASSTHNFELGTNQDLVSLSSGSLNIGAGTLGFSDFNFTTLAGFAPNTTYNLFQTSNAITGSLAAGVTGIVGGYSSTLAISGNNLVLNVVPEPATAVLVLAGVLWILIYRRAGARLRQNA